MLNFITVPTAEIADLDRISARSSEEFYLRLCRELARIRLKTEIPVLYRDALGECLSSGSQLEFDPFRVSAHRFQFNRSSRTELQTYRFRGTKS